jgi:hypothetical protein
MGRDLERKIGAYAGRIKDLEKNICILLVNLTGFKLLCGMWRIKTASEDRFQKIAEAALTKWNDTSMSFQLMENRIHEN